MSKIVQLKDGNDNAYPIVVKKVTQNDGTALMFADGTMICCGQRTSTVNITQQSGGQYYTSSTFTYPVEFKEAPTVTASITQASGILWTALGNSPVITKTGVQVRVLANNTVSNAAITFMYIAIGRWK